MANDAALEGMQTSKHAMVSQESSQTLEGASGPGSTQQSEKLDLSAIHPIMILNAHINHDDELAAIEEGLYDADAPISYDPKEARLFIGKIQRKPRAILELRKENVYTEEVIESETGGGPTGVSGKDGSSDSQIGRKRSHVAEPSQPSKKQVVDLTVDDETTDDSATESGSEVPRPSKVKRVRVRGQVALPKEEPKSEDTENVRVIRAQWLFDCQKALRVLPVDDYVVYRGRRTERPKPPPRVVPAPKISAREASDAKLASSFSGFGARDSILTRARDEAEPPRPSQVSRKRFHGAVEQRDREASYASQSQKYRSKSDGVAQLLQQSTTEHDLNLTSDMPEPPEWIKKGYKYSCQRSTPANHPNRKFVDMLKDVRVVRDLSSDMAGVRAYSTAIATIAAYPYLLTSSREVQSLPGCSARIAAVWTEWKNSGERDIEAVREANNDSRIKVLKLFFGIWGVGAATAREFYNRGWRELDDIVEQGWTTLSRVQQIGVKYYDEFLEKIPRTEVEEIRDIVHRHAQEVCGDPDGVRTTIVGGYRRGKAESGDADIMVSHLVDARTLDIVDDIADSLHEEGWITHKLGTTHSGSKRDQQTLAYKGPGAGRGFDSLDKAMVVWQDPRYNEEDAVDGKNPNVHRRVDIIISPWRTIGCAVLGWSAGTTFERDLRQYAKDKKKWKFDSSGIRDRETGQVVDVEAIGGRAETIDEAERRVFTGLGLEYREPWERCTG